MSANRRAQLAAAAVGSGLLLTSAATGSLAGAATPRTLTVVVGQITNPPGLQQRTMQTLIQMFEKIRPGVKVNWETYSSSGQEATMMETAAVSHVGPDVFEMGSTFVPTAAATGAFLTITPKMWDWLGGAWTYFASARSMDGLTPSQPVAVPEMAVPFALLYNKRLFAKAGITSPPATWTQFVQDAEKITDPKAGVYGVGMDLADSYDPWHVLWVLTRQLGGEFVSADGKKAELNSPPVLEAARFWFSWLTKFHIAPPQSVTWKGPDMLNAFAAGKLGMLVLQGLTVLPALKGTPVANDWAFAPMPTIPYGMTHLPPGGVPVQSFVSGQYLGVFKFTKERDDALAWIRFLTSPPAQLVFWRNYRYMPVRLQTYQKYPELQTPLVRTFYQAEVHSYPTPKVGAWGQMEVLVAKATAQVAGEIATHTLKPGDIARAFDQANSQLQPLLK